MRNLKRPRTTCEIVGTCSSRQSFAKGRTPRGELDRSEGKVAAEIAALDRRVTALETQGTKRAPRPPFPCRPREEVGLVIMPLTVAEKHLQILNGV